MDAPQGADPPGPPKATSPTIPPTSASTRRSRLLKILLVAGVAVVVLIVGIGIGRATKSDNSDELAEVRTDLQKARESERTAREAVSTTTTAPPVTSPPVTTPPAPPPNPPTISLAEFTAIQSGWSMQQVIDTVGGPGQVEFSSQSGSYKLESYKWTGSGFGSFGGAGSASIQFQNDQVSGKSQFGLQ
jgi:hypothetical protein